MSGNIEKVCIIGTGKLAFQCAALAKERGTPVTLFDMGQKKSVFLEKQSEAAGIPFFFQEPGKVFETLEREEKRLLLVSAINERILPAGVLEKENIRAVNLHQALLPAHPGRNAEAWAIFEQDEEAGITWHDMVKKVDSGGILIQKRIPLDENMTSYLLFKKQIECAYEAYQEIFDSLMDGSRKGIPQKREREYKFHYKKDVPAGGVLDMSWSEEKISAFLRAMDYAGLSVFDRPKLLYEGKTYQWKKYEIRKEQNAKKRPPCMIITDCDIVIQKGTTRFLLKNYNLMEETNDGKTDEHFKGIKTGD
ncbi:MAG: hypothetical protein HDR01_13270 [Lachnospiraceae bacterium]|nr:hypothetical protein [Lachnospiraceae bacterium]